MRHSLSKYIKKRYKEEKSKDTALMFPSNYEAILREYQKIVHKEKKYVVFSDYPFKAKTLNGSPMLPFGILLSREWAFKAVLFDLDDTRNAFRVTIGHELTHKEKEYPKLFYRGYDRKFIAQTTEVYADYNGAKRMINSSRKNLLRSIQYKRSHKISIGEEDTGDFAHPSWERREYYVTNFNFTADLIKQIADDVNCQNERLINSVISFYDDIVLI